MLSTERIVVTEGRYDKSRLTCLVDARIITTEGFGVYRDPALRGLLRRLAIEYGLVILTDSDEAGFRIRSYIKGFCPPGTCFDALIPDIYGKEKRKRKPGAEGKLGVEGVPDEVIVKALTDSGAFDETDSRRGGRRELTGADMYALGLSGTPDSSSRRKALLKKLDLPERLGSNLLRQTLSALYTYDELLELTRGL